MDLNLASAQEDKTALFPVGEKWVKKSEPVSTRAVKHIEDMMTLVVSGEVRRF